MITITILPKQTFFLRDGLIHYQVVPQLENQLPEYETTIVDLQGNSTGIIRSYEYEFQLSVELTTETKEEFEAAYKSAIERLKI